jgi:hypothetical protein
MTRKRQGDIHELEQQMAFVEDLVARPAPPDASVTELLKSWAMEVDRTVQRLHQGCGSDVGPLHTEPRKLEALAGNLRMIQARLGVTPLPAQPALPAGGGSDPFAGIAVIFSKLLFWSKADER